MIKQVGGLIWLAKFPTKACASASPLSTAEKSVPIAVLLPELAVEVALLVASAVEVAARVLPAPSDAPPRSASKKLGSGRMMSLERSPTWFMRSEEHPS